MKLVWDELAWDDYLYWQRQDRKVARRINQLIADIQRNGNDGIGKPDRSGCLRKEIAAGSLGTSSGTSVWVGQHTISDALRYT